MSTVRDERIIQLESMRGRHVLEITHATRGFTNAIRARVQHDDGSTAFIKAAVDEETARWLRKEVAMYQSLRGAAFMPVLHDVWEDEQGLPVMLIEDLSEALWPGHGWTSAQIDTVLHGLEQVASSTVPEHVESMSAHPRDYQGWSSIAQDPSHFSSLGFVSEAELSDMLPSLIAAQDAVDLDAPDLVHMDVRSDNMCLHPERGLVLVDWNWAVHGERRVDVGFWLPSLALEGGPQPWEVWPADRSVASVISGFFCAQAGKPAWPGGERVRAFQLAQARVAWRWVMRELDMDQGAP